VRPRPEDQEWYFFKAGSDAGLKAGPFSWERLLVQARNGSLEPADVVWDPNSGWKTATQVPGLFPAKASSGVAGPLVDTPPLGPPPSTRGRSRLYWLSALVALVIVGGGLGAYFGLRNDGGDATATTTTIPVTTTQQASTTTEATAVSQSPVTYLGNKDDGHEVRLHVGDRVRVDLQPRADDRIKSLRWDYSPGVVREIGSDSVVADAILASSWLELQAVVAGKVTVKAEYEFPDGIIRVNWVVYIRVEW
jgi:hypothetical protein